MRAFDRDELERHAYQIRRYVVETVATNGEGHAGGALSAADILSVIFFSAFRDERDPKLRDKLILSGGHKCLALYGALVELGYLPAEQLKTYNHLGTVLPGHPDCTKVPAIDFSTGSLGHGLPVGCGIVEGPWDIQKLLKRLHECRLAVDDFEVVSIKSKRNFGVVFLIKSLEHRRHEDVVKMLESFDGVVMVQEM